MTIKSLSILSVIALCLSVFVLPSLAWDCPNYRFGVESNGSVFVQNASALDESAATAEVAVNGLTAAIFPVPALAHSSAVVILGTVKLPVGPYQWQMKIAECVASGQGELATVPPPTGGDSLVCITLDKGNLWGKLEIWQSNAAGERLDGFRGYAEVNADNAIVVYAAPGQNSVGYFLVIDEQGTRELFYLEAGMILDCLGPDNHDCRRIYAIPPRGDCHCHQKPL